MSAFGCQPDPKSFKALHQRTRLSSSHRVNVRDPSRLEAPGIIATLLAFGSRVAFG